MILLQMVRTVSLVLCLVFFEAMELSTNATVGRQKETTKPASTKLETRELGGTAEKEQTQKHVLCVSLTGEDKNPLSNSQESSESGKSREDAQLNWSHPWGLILYQHEPSVRVKKEKKISHILFKISHVLK